jgi:ATP/maltotriose-dependent transcriptional regulator MalT
MTPDASPSGTGIVGRGDELSRLDSFLDDLSGGPAAFVLEGESGIGKTTLWKRGVAAAGQRGYQVFSIRPSESEAKLSYAGLADLLDGAHYVFETLPAPQRRALEVALLQAEPGRTPPDPRAVFSAVLAVLRQVASRGPLVMALDDVQWLDLSTTDALRFAVRRLDTEPIGLLAATRGAGSALPLGVSRSFPEERVTRLAVEPLSVDELADLIHDRLDTRLPSSALKPLHEMSGGNPFYALEIARATLRGDRRATGQALPVPRSLRDDLVRDRLGALPSLVREFLLYIAASPRATQELLESAMGVASLEPQLAKAEKAGVVETRRGEVHFTHPIFGSVIYAEASRDHRHRIHRRLSEVVVDGEERVRHLALAADRRDAAVAVELADAADLESRRGVPIAAGELYELAEQLTPPDDAERGRRLRLVAADCWYVAGDPVRAERLLESVRLSAPPGRERAEALWRLARLRQLDDAHRAARLSSEALEQEGSPPGLLSRIHVQLAWALAAIGDLTGAGTQAEGALAEAEHADEPVLLLEALLLSARVRAWRGEGIPHDLLRRAEEIAGSVPVYSMLGAPNHVLAMLLMEAGELDEGRRMFQSLLDLAAERGDEFSTIEILSDLARIDWRAGKWASALANLSAVARLAPGATSVFSDRALVEAYQGDELHAVAGAEVALALTEESGVVGSQIGAMHALGHLRLSLGDPAGAHEHLARAWGLLRRAGFGDPGTFPFVPDHVEALVELGSVDEAEPIVDWLEERGRTLDRAYALATGARCRAMLLAARGDLGGGLTSLDEAMTHHERLPMPFERGRTLLTLGAVRRRARQKAPAREALEQALQVFDGLGARLWAEKTRSELARIGGRRAVVGELTVAERRVAKLAAAGRTNREIAGTLFMSVRTVEGTLSHAYAKLGIRSRTELALFFDEPHGPADPPDGTADQ